MRQLAGMMALAGLLLGTAAPAMAETPVYHWAHATAPPAGAVYAANVGSTHFAFCAFMGKRKDWEPEQLLSGYFNQGRCNAIFEYGGRQEIAESPSGATLDFLVVDAGAPEGTWANCLSPGSDIHPSNQMACKVPEGHVVDRRFRWPVTICSFGGTAHFMVLNGSMQGFGQNTATVCRPTQNASWRDTKVLIGEIR
ncbi:MAG: hypothetical protein JSS36_04505 [Proteobacteria bacterium]|nr:hypothetical protein [Pseudomonadota bacterium]